MSCTSPCARQLVVLAALGACGTPPPAPAQPIARDRIAIVASERGPRGARLVAIDEHGDRQFPLIAAPDTVVRDTHPALSPDGRWIVFASSRDRDLGSTSLWIAPLGPEAVPTRLTFGDSIESHPTWTPDGAAIVFASTRDGGDFDLWRLALVDGQPAGEPTQLTTGEGHEITPTVAVDGTVIYAAITPKGGTEVESRLEERRPDGTVHVLTTGPADASPALSPDGWTLAFSRPVVHDGTPSAELWTMPRGSSTAIAVTALPLTDESGPAWSHDGRFLFATSVLHVDLREREPRARMLRDRAGAIARLTPAIAARDLDVAALHADPEYLSELARIVSDAIERRQGGAQ
jgi:Tol biopolymer transport system component